MKKISTNLAELAGLRESSKFGQHEIRIGKSSELKYSDEGKFGNIKFGWLKIRNTKYSDKWKFGKTKIR